MNDFKTVKLNKESGTLWVELSRPSIGNSYNVQMRDELDEIFSLIFYDDEIKTVLLSGAGDNFCTGADLTEFGTAPSPVIARNIRWKRDLWKLFIECPKPIVTAIHGYCIGSGLEMALLTDIRICAKTTTFYMPESRLGLLPAAGGTQSIARSSRFNTSQELLYNGSRVDSQTALSQGIVSRVIQDDKLMTIAFEICKQINQISSKNMAAIKTYSNFIYRQPIKAMEE